MTNHEKAVERFCDRRKFQVYDEVKGDGSWSLSFSPTEYGDYTIIMHGRLRSDLYRAMAGALKALYPTAPEWK